MSDTKAARLAAAEAELNEVNRTWSEALQAWTEADRVRTEALRARVNADQKWGEVYRKLRAIKAEP